MSESKFINNPAAFIPHIQSRNRDALEALITKPEVEIKLLGRLQKKVETYSQDILAEGDSLPKTNGTNGIRRLNGNGTGKIDIDGVLDLYESYIIPLTKEVEASPHRFLYVDQTLTDIVRWITSSIVWMAWMRI